MAAPFDDVNPVRKTYFINASEKSVDPTDDEGKVVQLEADGFLSEVWLPVLAELRNRTGRDRYPIRHGLINVFETLASPPATLSSDGNKLVWTGGDFLYALRASNTQTLYRYQISTNSWTTLANSGVLANEGTNLIWDGGDFLYATIGQTTSFRRYEISTNTWAALTAAPASLGTGASAVYDGDDSIYVTRGGTTSTFYRYTISTNSWTTLAVASAIGNIGQGGRLVYPGGDRIFLVRGTSTSDFGAYSISANSWQTFASMQGAVNEGLAIFDGFKSILYFDGTNIHRYDIGQGVWGLAKLPASLNVSLGGGVVYTGENDFLILRNGSNFHRFSGEFYDWQPWMK